MNLEENTNQVIENDFRLRERLLFFKEQHKKHGNCREVLYALEDVYLERVIGEYRIRGMMNEAADAIRWYGEYERWIK